MPRDFDGVISMRRSFTAFINVNRPRGDSASSPVSKYVGHALKQKPHCTHLYRSSSAGATAVMKPRSGMFGVDFKTIPFALYAEREPSRIQHMVSIKLKLHILHDLGSRHVNPEDVDMFFHRNRTTFNQE